MQLDRTLGNQRLSRKRENVTLALLSLTFGLVMFDRVALNLLLPFIAPEFGLGAAEIGLLASALGLSWAISGLIVARMADRRMTHKLWLIISIALFSLASISTALATSFLSLLVLRLVLGLAEGPVLPLAQTIMSSESSPTRLGFNLGVVQNFASGLLGTLLAPILLVWLATEVNWRGAFVIASLPGLLLALICALYLRQPRRIESSKTPAPSFRELLRSRNLRLTLFISSMLLMWLTLMLIFLPVYLVQERGMEAMDMGLLMSLMGLAGVIASLGVSRISDVVGRKPTLVVFSLLGVLAPVAPIVVDASIASLLLPMAIGYLAVGCFPQAASTVPAESVPPAGLAAAVGLVVAVAEMVGGVLAPVAAGIAGELWSPAAPLVIAAIGGLLAGIASFFLIETAPSRMTRPSLVSQSNAMSGRS